MIWIHLGKSKVAPYLKRSLKNFSDIFTNHPLILLVDNDRNIENLKIKNLQVKKIDYMDTNWRVIKNDLKHDLNFRDEFWFNSLGRFGALHKYMEMEGIDSLLHIESDVTFLPNFPIEKMSKMKDVLAYPLQGDGQGIASVFHVGSRATLSHFLTFCREQVQMNPKSTDMTILYNFFDKYPEKVLILPTLPKHASNDVEIRDRQSFASQNLDLLGGIIDAISIGQYLFGVDPRNRRGIKKLYWEDPTHWVKPSLYRYEFTDNELLAKKDKATIKVFSLHIHSKDPLAFSNNSLPVLLAKRFQESLIGEREEIVYKEVLKAIYKSIKRRAVRLWN